MMLRVALPVTVQFVVQMEDSGKPLQAESVAAASKVNKNMVFVWFMNTPALSWRLQPPGWKRWNL